MAPRTSTKVADMPAEVLTHILATISSPRDRNCVSLVCRNWRLFERQTRRHLLLRGNLRTLLNVPRCFVHVTSLDLSHLSPWGYSLLNAGTPSLLLATLSAAFPAVTDVRFYTRDRADVGLVAAAFPNLESAALVRWHSKGEEAANLAPGVELVPLLAACPRLRALDLSSFYCWTDDVPPAVAARPDVAKGLRVLNLLKLSPDDDAFRNGQLKQVAEGCPALQEFRCVCVFDPRHTDCVNDEGLLALGAHCTELLVLTLVDLRDHNMPRMPSDAPSIPRANITRAGLEGLFKGLRKLEELSLALYNGLHACGAATASLKRHCPRLRSLHLGRCLEVGEDGVPDGLPACAGLQVLGIKYCAGLTDGGLSWICAKYPRLARLQLHGCPAVTPAGVRHLAEALRDSLTHVALTHCGGVPTKQALAALAPLQPTLESLHLDCNWRQEVSAEARRPPHGVQAPGSVPAAHPPAPGGAQAVPPAPLPQQPMAAAALSAPRAVPPPGSAELDPARAASTSSAASPPPPSTWPRLRQLSLWVPLGLLLRPLEEAGLEGCPALQEVTVSVAGNCRDLAGPGATAFGLQTLTRFPFLDRLCVDLSAVTGFPQSCPPGFKDLAYWERFFMHGLQALPVKELDYWPPSDHDRWRREMWFPCASLLGASRRVRRLRLHGTASEHAMQALLRCATLRDAYIWSDFYPAPDEDTVTSMRLTSFQRFAHALDSRRVAD